MGETLTDTDGKIKSLTRRILENRDLFPAALVLVVGLVSFGLGRLSVEQAHIPSGSQLLSSVSEARAGDKDEPVPTLPSASGIVPGNTMQPQTISAAGLWIGGQRETRKKETRTASQRQAISAAGQYVASKNSDKYHLPWCSGAARIAEKNKVWFASKEEAAAAGYTPAANCKGI